MEQAIWIFFSVLATVLALGSISMTVIKNEGDVSFHSSLQGLDQIQSQCNYVCNSGEGTSLSADVPLGSNSILYTSDEKICLDYQDKIRCRVCDCSLLDYKLNLSSEFAQEALDRHIFTCFMTREENGVSIECQG